MQAKKSKPAKKGQAKLTEMAPSVAVDSKTNVVQGTVKPEIKSDEFCRSINVEDGNILVRPTKDVKDVSQLENQSSGVNPKFQSPAYKGLHLFNFLSSKHDKSMQAWVEMRQKSNTT